MSSSPRSNAFRRVLVDMNTQCDFLLPNGALPVSNRREILPNIRSLMNWARLNRIPVISSLEAHRPGERRRGLPAHCVDRTNGQKKLPFTLLPKRALLFGDNTIDVPQEVFRRLQQVIFTKRDRDFLSNPKADRLVNNLDVNHLVVFGVVTEYCIKAAALGLLTRRHRVVVVTDACGHWNQSDQELAFRQMDAKGTVLVTTSELISGAADERIAAAKRPTTLLDEEEGVLEGIGAAGFSVGTNGHGSNGKSGNGHDAHLANPELLRAELTRKGLRSAKSKSRSEPGLA